jgi:rhamnulokinase
MGAIVRGSSVKAVAVDFGASSARFALGELAEDAIEFRIVEQIAHKPVEWNGHDVWDFDALLLFCRRALDVAEQNGAASLGIDTWGVDHGFLDESGRLIQPPVCYRDSSHDAVFEELKEDRPWLYSQTGIQHQPFNTLYQLIARQRENPELFGSGVEWLLLPDLLLSMLGGDRGYERSIASTTQLADASGNWNAAVFERYGLPMPNRPISKYGPAGTSPGGVALTRIGGHDTASAVLGMGSLGDAVFANLGTWALVGKVGEFDASADAEARNLTNERMVDGRVRLLRNVPGFYIANRLHEELGIATPVGEWLERAETDSAHLFDVFDPALYAPASMAEAVSRLIGKEMETDAEWAGAAIMSLVEALFGQFDALGGSSIRLTGGGSRNPRLCQSLADRTGAVVRVGPSEATLLGNLALQFEVLGGGSSATGLADRSLQLIEYRPQVAAR